MARQIAVSTSVPGHTQKHITKHPNVWDLADVVEILKVLVKMKQ